VKRPGHPAISELLQYFEFKHLPPHLAKVSEWCHDLAHKVACGDSTIAEGPELTAGLRKLLEAKDCFVRAAIRVEPEGPQR
jgi:hypothetical protein